MSAALPWAELPFRRMAEARAQARGRWLTHLVGLCIVAYLFLDRIWLGHLPYTGVTDVPIRLVAIWLLLDRTGRIGRVKLNLWDALHIGFIASYGLALIFADAFLVRRAGLFSFVEWAADFAGPYLLFVIVREGTLRKGFRLEGVVAWTLAALAAAGVLGLLQAANIGPFREWSSLLYHWRHFDYRIAGPSAEWQARGPTPHANSLAFLMVLGLALVPAALRYPGIRPWAWASAAVFLAAAAATYSRMGALGSLAVMATFAGVYAWRRTWRMGAVWGLVLAAVGLSGLAAVYAFDVQRFKAVLEGEGRVKNTKEEFGGWYARKQGMRQALDLGLEHPVFGLGATGAGSNRMDVIVRNSYSFSAVLTGLYAYALVQYGLFGLLYVVGSLAFLAWLATLRALPAHTSASAAGVAMAVACFGISENSLFLAYAVGVIHVAAALFACTRAEAAP